jgi:hypothetical protein
MALARWVQVYTRPLSPLPEGKKLLVMTKRLASTPRKSVSQHFVITSSKVNYTTTFVGNEFENCATMTKRLERMARRGGS